MELSGDLNDIPRPVLIGGGIAVLAVFLGLLLFLTHRFIYPIFGTGIAHVAPLPGFPDVAPYNTPEWQATYKKTGAPTTTGRPGGPMMPPVPGAPLPGQAGAIPVGNAPQ
jgi:hypothetical protein